MKEFLIATYFLKVLLRNSKMERKCLCFYNAVRLKMLKNLDAKFRGFSFLWLHKRKLWNIQGRKLQKKRVKFAMSNLFEMVFLIMHFHTFTLSFFINIFLIKLTLRWQSYLKFKGSEATTEIANVDHLIKAGCGRFPFAIS